MDCIDYSQLVLTQPDPESAESSDDEYLYTLGNTAGAKTPSTNSKMEPDFGKQLALMPLYLHFPSWIKCPFDHVLAFWEKKTLHLDAAIHRIELHPDLRLILML